MVELTAAVAEIVEQALKSFDVLLARTQSSDRNLRARKIINTSYYEYISSF